jgi:uncharacterized protein
MKIAIIGSGISGLTCAHLLHDKHEISVFESDSRIGGHTATKDIVLNDRHYAIDTGFIVFNDWTYPNFIKLMSDLGVASQPTSMSFSVVNESTGREYGGSRIAALFAQRRNWFNPKHWLMLRDIVRFNREANLALQNGILSDGMTLREYLKINAYSDVFRDNYLIPMGSAIWSTSLQDMLDMPVLFFVRFFRNHGLLSIKNRPQWRVIQGGSISYLAPLSKGYEQNIRLNAKIRQVERSHDQVRLTMSDGVIETFDQVVFACHSDQVLRLLIDYSDDEQEILGSIPYAENEVVLHTDERLLPKRKAAWSSWNYRIIGSKLRPPVLSYNMNILQGIDSEHTFVVTLNATDRIEPARILGRYYYSHPQFNLDSVQMQQQWQKINGVNRTWFCGAYWRNGFHEDGCVSGIRVANQLGADWELLDE